MCEGSEAVVSPQRLFVRAFYEATLRSVCCGETSWRLLIRGLFQTALLRINEFSIALPLVPSVINNKLIYSALAVTRSTGQPSKRLFSGLVLFFVITVQVAALSSGSIKRPQPVLQLESEREPSDGGWSPLCFQQADNHRSCTPSCLVSSDSN